MRSPTAGLCCEHHDGQIAYFGPYGCSPQWAARSAPVTNGKAFNYAVTNTAAGRDEYVGSNCYAYVNQQSDYAGVAPWGSFHPTGLPSRVTSESKGRGGAACSPSDEIEDISRGGMSFSGPARDLRPFGVPWSCPRPRAAHP